MKFALTVDQRWGSLVIVVKAFHAAVGYH